MPRSEARIFTSIWEDDDFTILPPSAQRMYLFLVSQPDLSYCGVISLRERRWSKGARGMTVDEVRANLELLSQELHGGAAPMIVVDEDTEEVFVRSLIRHDGIWKQPNLMKSARTAATLVRSPQIRAALLAELRRIPAQEADSRLVRTVHASFLADLGDSLDSPKPNPSANPSGNSFSLGSLIPSQGEGVRNGSSTTGPLSPLPPPPAPGEGWPIEPDDEFEVEPEKAEGEIEEKESPADEQFVASIVADVKAIRPEWSERSIRRVLAQPSVVERPVTAIRRAALAVANDRTSQAPGRLEHDGPWWSTRPPTPSAPYDRPPPPLGPKQYDATDRGAAEARALLAKKLRKGTP